MEETEPGNKTKLWKQKNASGVKRKSVPANSMDEDEKIRLIERGVKIGMEHKSMSKETEKEIGEMRDEWSDAKSFVRNIALIVGGVLLGYGVWVGTIETRIDDYGNRISNSEKVAEDLRGKLQTAEVVNAGVQQKLNNIESSLLEIKNALRIK